MTVPIEFELASAEFTEFLVDARDISELWSTHVTYTMVQGVLQVFRRRLTTQQAIDFAHVLPICLRVLFIQDWIVDAEIRSFGTREEMTLEVKQLRAAHNFSTKSAISDVAKALRRHVNENALDELLEQLPAGAADFWRV